MNDETLNSPSVIKAFLAGTCNVEMEVPKPKRYDWLTRKLRKTCYFGLSKKEKSTVREYVQKMTGYSKAQLTVNLGEPRKPNPEGQPGYIRIDTVHQGDQDKQKGVYHINVNALAECKHDDIL